MYQIQGPPMLSNLQKMKDGIKQPRKRKNNRSTKSIQKGGTRQQQQGQLPKRPTTNRKGMIVTDRVGTPITVFDGASHGLSELNKWKMNDDEGRRRLAPIQTAVASCTNKPSFARQCMKWLVVDDGSTLSSCFDHIEIRPGDKRKHFESLQRITNIPYERMLFFDDYDLNIESVGSLGVRCIHTPNGMTRDAWDEGIEMFGLN
jgi:magnesium-dependent phosphatase-1